MELKLEGLNRLSRQLNAFQIKAGFTDSNIPQRLMLVVSEVSEAFEAFRNDKYSPKEETTKYDLLDTKKLGGNLFKQYFEDIYKDTFEDELADSIIRLLALCGENDIDIEFHIKQKMDYNELRGHKYGGKKF